MKLKSIFLVTLFFLLLGSSVYPQTTPLDTATKAIKSSPAYAEVLLRKTELEADVESFLISYTEDYPKLKEARFELVLIQKDLAKLISQADPSKLTLALGKLMVRKNQLETDFWALQNQYGKEHPEVKRAERKATIFRNAIKEILP
jgi:hypothetical protein